MFKVNQKIVCIDDSVDPKIQEQVNKLFPLWVKEGSIYTVRQPITLYPGKPGVLLNELVNPLVHGSGITAMFEPYFSIKRFVPIEWWEESEYAVNELLEELELVECIKL
jgi:hypothetical protein